MLQAARLEVLLEEGRCFSSVLPLKRYQSLPLLPELVWRLERAVARGKEFGTQPIAVAQNGAEPADPLPGTFTGAILLKAVHHDLFKCEGYFDG